MILSHIVHSVTGKRSRLLVYNKPVTKNQRELITDEKPWKQFAIFRLSLQANDNR